MRQATKEAAEAAGMKVSINHGEDKPRRRDRLADRPAHLVSAQWPYAVARMARIMEGTGQGGATTTEQALKTAAMPKLAREFRDLFFHYQFRHRLSRFNPFLGLSDHDSARKLHALVIAICDRSTGKLGPWYVK